MQMDAEGLYRDPLHAEGWFRDPYLVHEDRWFSDGLPTKLVRDGAVEGYDPPPPGPPKAELVAAPRSEMGGSDPRRADDDPIGYNKKEGFLFRYGNNLP